MGKKTAPALPQIDRQARPDEGEKSEPSRDEMRAWALAAMHRCADLEKVLRQVVVWFDGPLEAANDDHQIVAEARDLNRIIDSAIALLQGSVNAANAVQAMGGGLAEHAHRRPMH